MVKKRLENIAYKYIRDAIMTYELMPGQVIVEQDLSDAIGISRTPVRDALKQLQMEGLVRQIPSRGTFVTDITLQDVEELFQIRVLLETVALKVAIMDATEAELNAAYESLNMLDDKQIDDKTTKELYYDSDRSLHYLIMKYSRNSRMIAFHKNIESQLERLRRISSITPMRLAVSRKEHLDIIEAIRSRDLEKAEEALVTHLSNVKASTLNVCKNLRLGIIEPE